MSTEKNLNNLVINKVENQDVYDYMKANNLINSDELYLIEGNDEVSIPEATQTSSGLMSAEDKTRLDGLVATGGEANQNAFSNVVIGENIITADSATDTLTITAGNNITLIPDETSNGVSIAAKVINRVESQEAYDYMKENGLLNAEELYFIEGVNELATSTQVGLMSPEDKAKLDTISENAEENVQSDWNTTDTTSDAFIKNKPTTLPADGGNADTVNGHTVEANVPADAVFTDTVYTHPMYDTKSNGLYKITVDDTGHVSDVSTVTKTDITALGIPAQDTTYSEATTTSAGLMSATDKSRLDGLVATGGEANQNAFSNVVVGDKIITADNTTDTLTITAGDNITLTPDETNNGITISSKDTTYGAAGASLGLVKTGGDATISDGVITIAELDSKVDKVDGKGLSTNDLTATLKSNYDTAYTHSQQAHAPADAEKNVIVGVQKNGADLTVNSSTRKVNITVPTKTSELTNDSNFATISDVNAAKTIVDSALSFTSTNPVQNSVVKAALDGKVDTEQGKGLSTNDLTDSLKSNYDVAYTHSQQAHAPADAEANVIVSIQKNGTDLTITNKKVNITVPTKITDLTNDSDFATTTQLDTKVDKVTGKGLSTNDYTTEDKEKLAAIEDGANKTVVDAALSATSTNPVQNKIVNTKFTNIQADIDSRVPSSRTVNGKSLTDDIILSASDVGALPDTTVIPSIDGLATEGYVDEKVAGLVGSAPETLDTLNELASALGGDANFATTVANQIGTKVDKVDGKGLSANDYTDAEKAKLEGIATGAQVNQNAFSNVIVGSITIAAGDITDSLTLAAGDNVTINADAANDKITISAIDTTYNEAGTELGLVKSGGDVTISNGIITVDDDSHNHIISNIDGLQAKLDEKVNKIDGKGLSTNDLTSTLKSNYDTAYIHSQQPHNYAGSSTSGGAATSANKLNTDAGSETQPVYFKDGVPIVINTLDSVAFDGYVTKGAESGSTIGASATVEGGNNMASSKQSHAEGGYTRAGDLTLYSESTGMFDSYGYEHAEGYSTLAKKCAAHAEGAHTQATALMAHAEGLSTIASGSRAHAEGHSTEASGTNSHAEGSSTTASGENAHAEGKNTISSSQSTHAEGYNTEASGYASHSEGASTVVSGSYSHAEGFYTKASSENQHVQGKYNIEDTANTYAHIVGNGTSDTARSNAHTLDWSGNAWFAGKVTSENADYAEVGQWADGNVNDEDRIGYFVAIDDTTEGRTMVKATSTADVRGVTVDSPAFSGGYSADKADSNGELLKQYDYVAVMGIVSVIDNGTCTVNGRCMPADDGTAIPSTNNLGYQIIERIDSTHVMIAIEPGADMIQRIKTDVNELQGHASAMDIHVTAEEKEKWNESILLANVTISLPSSTKWESVAYGNGKFVAVTTSDVAAYSEDGINWTQTTLPVSSGFSSVAYGNGKFVAIAWGQKIAVYSEDGINWTQTTLPFSGYWSSVAYGNGKFVAVGGGNNPYFAYSEDGINWSLTGTVTNSYQWCSVAYGNGKFVAVGESDLVAYSEDGINWSLGNLPINAKWTSVAYGNGKFVAIYTGNGGAYSEDGINWTRITTASSFQWESLVYGNGKFVAVANDSYGRAMYSEDGITWTHVNISSFSTWWKCVTYGNGKFIAISNKKVIYSKDGINWFDTSTVLQTVLGEDIKDDLRNILSIDQPVSLEEKEYWNNKADAPFKPTGKSYLTFSSPNSFTLAVNDATKHWDGTLEYFAEDKTWATWDGTTTLSSVNNDGEYVLYLRGTGNTVITGDYNYRWVLTGSDIKCMGNIENLLDYETVEYGQHPTMAEYCYDSMFNGCTSLSKAPTLLATTLADYCYHLMFYGCSSLTEAPDLPATTMASNCYDSMFQDCTSLTKAPSLPATTLANYCYTHMFFGCTSLTQAPFLPATTLANYCYQSMFEGCSSLTQAPALPATTLATYCYKNMFRDCTSLTKASALPATTLSECCYLGMFYGCTSLIQVPDLPATTLATNCYYSIFRGCTKIKLSTTRTGEYTQEYCIPSSGTGTTASNALRDMFYSTGGTFTGTPEINTTYYLSSDNMIVYDTEVAALREYVGAMIDAAIGNAIGGSY